MVLVRALGRHWHVGLSRPANVKSPSRTGNLGSLDGRSEGGLSVGGGIHEASSKKHMYVHIYIYIKYKYRSRKTGFDWIRFD